MIKTKRILNKLGKKKFCNWLRKVNEHNLKFDLRGTNLYGADLRGVDLKKADLKRVKLAFPEYETVGISAKTGKGMKKFYEALFRTSKKTR